MKLWDKLKKGAKYVAMAFEKDKLTDRLIIEMINNDKASNKKVMMIKGDKYYTVENDILNITKNKKDYQSDERLAHGIFHSLIDEKVEYSFSKNPSITSNNGETAIKVIELLGYDFQYNLETLAYEASKKGIAWCRPYVDMEGDLKLFIPKSEQIIPGWKDASHRELDYLIRYYDSKVFRFNKLVDITNVEVWFPDEVKYYRLDGSQLLPIQSAEGHFWRDGEPESWGRVPWIAFKNNRDEMSDLQFVKSLIDGYDMSRTEVANFINDVRNLIFVLKGYDGDSLDEFMAKLLKYRAVVLDSDEGADVNTLTPQMDITSVKQHYEQLKRDIYDYGQGVNRDLDKFGSAPSGIALKFLFSGLDLKNNQIESEFRRGFEQLVEFIFLFLNNKNESIVRDKVEIVFARDIPLNETESIQNCNNSRGLISNATIIANHPWVQDVSDEIEKIEKENMEMGESFNTVTLEGEEDE
ncbi:phage portal protein [Helcococcus kunzii]|uniref:phage portal protein n=1 Tax=Helcococcus kunzii TaxID=40091 RepID=UPI0038AC103A